MSEKSKYLIQDTDDNTYVSVLNWCPSSLFDRHVTMVPDVYTVKNECDALMFETEESAADVCGTLLDKRPDRHFKVVKND